MMMVQGTNQLRRQDDFGRPKKRKYDKIILIVLAVLLLQMLSVLYLDNIEYQTSPTYSQIRIDPEGKAKLAWPGDGQSSLGTVDHGLLDTQNQNSEPIPIASITKLFTALAVLKKKPISTSGDQNTITFSSTDEWLYMDYLSRGGAVVPVAAGQQLTEYEALQAMLIPSANNMADALAIWAFGSMDAYLDYVNNMADNMGMDDTQIADASGFSPDSVSTSEDLIKLGQAAMEHPIIASIIRRPYSDLPNIGRIYNTNELLGENGVIGGKTGNTDEAGDCLLFMANHTPVRGDTQTFVGVVLGQQTERPETFKRVSKLLDSTKQGFTNTTVVNKGDVVGRYITEWGEEVPIVANEKVEVLAWKDAEIKPELWIDEAEAGLPDGQKVGSLVLTSGEKTYETTLSLGKKLNKPPVLWRLANIFTYH